MANEFKVRKGLVVNGSGSVILDVQGSQGQLFSVTDQLSGSLFSVNDISGVPVLEAFSDSTVKIGQYLSEAIVVSGSTARITGSIAMAGFSSGSVLFAGPGGSISQNNASFFWDNTNGRLGINTNTPTYPIIDAVGANFRFGRTGQVDFDITNPATPRTLRINVGSGDPIIQTLGAYNLAFNVNFNRIMTLTPSNVLIGFTSDTGERLQVSGSSRFAGDMVITGSGSTNATNALTILNSTGTGSLIVRNDGQIQVRSTNAGTPGYSFIDNTDTGLFMLGGGMYTVVDSLMTVAYGNNGITFNAVSGAANNESNANLQLTKAAVGHRLSIWLNASNDFHFEAWESSVGYANNIILNGYNGNVLIGSTTNTGQRLQVAGTSKFGGNMVITGSANITQALTSSVALISGSGTQRLTVVGSGSAQPLFTVQGSQGELFSIVDSLSGSLFSVNDQSGLPIMEVFSDNTTLVGNYLAPMLLTTARTSSAAGINTLYTLPTSSYDAVYIDYTIRSGSNARAGNFMAMWSGTSVNFTDNSITEFGTTSGFVFGAHISGSNMVVTGSSSTSGWTVKTIIKAI